ncbi:hypothetical protein Hanom_Chr12g01085671 [Helianthus anomalus]
MIFDFPPIFNTICNAHVFCLPYIFDHVISVLVASFKYHFPPNTKKHIGILSILFS